MTASGDKTSVGQPGFDDSLPMILHRTLDGVMPPYREIFARYELTDQQWRVLRVLWTSEKVTSAELAARTLITSPSLAGVIDRLEKRKLVARIRSVNDRRVVFVVASSKGRALEAQVTPKVSEIQARIRAAVTDKEWQAMSHTLNKIVSLFSDVQEKKAWDR